METVTVSLGARSYPICIEEQLLQKSGHFLSDLNLSSNAALITNATVAPLYADALILSLELAGLKVTTITLPDGEQYKNLTHLASIYPKLTQCNLDRNSPLIALGGGVIGDMTGFAASTFMRGLQFVQIPTTLLAQVDSSVGGKTGVNLAEGKNLVGTFYQPRIVLIDPLVLRTLPAREMQSGIAEIIKYALIHDADFFRYLEHNIPKITGLDMDTLKHVIKTCCSIKASITSQDETEKGIRAFLNFGHTIGHAIESLTGYSTYTHGEAVAIGMVAACRLSCRLGFCSREIPERILTILLQAGLPTDLPHFQASAYIETIFMDKKRTSDQIRMVLIKNIGQVFLMELEPGRLYDALINEFQLSQG